MQSNKVITIKKLSLKAQIWAIIFAVISAVVIPQLFHIMGAISGMGTSLGEIFLPMHLSIIFVGLLAGPLTGAISGFLVPLVSYGLTGMPTLHMLPFMMVELFAYGLCAGCLKNVKFPNVGKVFLVQIAGRVMRAVAILLAIYVFGYDKIGVASIWMSIPKGVVGIVLQLVLIPLLLYRLKDFLKNDE